MQSYLLACAECNRLCRCEAVGQESREAKQQTKDVQTHQSDDLFKIKQLSWCHKRKSDIRKWLLKVPTFNLLAFLCTSIAKHPAATYCNHTNNYDPGFVSLFALSVEADVDSQIGLTTQVLTWKQSSCSSRTHRWLWLVCKLRHWGSAPPEGKHTVWSR